MSIHGPRTMGVEEGCWLDLSAAKTAPLDTYFSLGPAADHMQVGASETVDAFRMSADDDGGSKGGSGARGLCSRVNQALSPSPSATSSHNWVESASDVVSIRSSCPWKRLVKFSMETSRLYAPVP